MGPGFRVAGRRQEVTAKSQASGTMSFPWWIQISAGLSRLGVHQAFFFRETKAFFLGSFVEDMGSGTMPAVEDLGPQVHCVSWSRNGLRRRGCNAVRARSTSQSESGEAAPPTNQAPAPGAWCTSREIRSLHQKIQGTCITQVGQVAPSLLVVLAPRSILTDAAAELCFGCGHVGVVGVSRAVAKGGVAAARGQESCWVSDTETAFLCREPSTFSDGHLYHFLEGSF